MENRQPPIYEVIASYPNNNDFPLGKRIEFKPWVNDGYWIHTIEDCQGKREYAPNWFDKYPHLFRKIE